MTTTRSSDPNSKPLEEQVKDLQRQIAKRDERDRRKSQALLDQSELQASVARLEYGFTKYLESEPERKPLADELKAQATSATTANAYRRQIMDAIERGDHDWNDKELVEARALWQTGDLAGSLRVVQGLFGAGGDGDTEARINAEVEKRMAERETQTTAARKVDTDGSTGGGGKKGYTRGEAATIFRPDKNGQMDFKGMKKAAGDFLDTVYTKR